MGHDILPILKDFHKISGFRVSIHDLDFNEIIRYPEKLNPFCEDIQKNPGGRNNCLMNDAVAFQKVKESGNVYIYKCGCGLYEVVAPIYYYGILSGFFMMGQVSDTKSESKSDIKKNSARFFDSEENLEASMKKIKTINVDMIESYINIMSILAEFITKTNRLNPYTEELAPLIKKHINQNFSKKITLDILCQKFGCRRATLMNNFKASYSTTINSYITEVRLKNAAELLAHGKEPVKCVSSSCGFSDQNYFSKAFYKKYGCTPTKYRMKFQTGENE